MLPNALIKGYDKVRLRNLLAIFFLALAIPTVILIWHAYGQLKWEAFHQYRGLAEELTSRIDTRLIDMVHFADASSFADYTFLVVTGDPSVNFLQRSPLSGYPVTGDPPGLLGYFQVDTRGAFSSPLLPPKGSDSLSRNFFGTHCLSITATNDKSVRGNERGETDHCSGSTPVSHWRDGPAFPDDRLW